MLPHTVFTFFHFVMYSGSTSSMVVSFIFATDLNTYKLLVLVY